MTTETTIPEGLCEALDSGTWAEVITNLRAMKSEDEMVSELCASPNTLRKWEAGTKMRPLTEKCMRAMVRDWLRLPVTKARATDEDAEQGKLTMTISLNQREQDALERLMAEQELSGPQVFKCALREYQMGHERRKSGETVQWSGDAQRLRDFAGAAISALPVERVEADELRQKLRMVVAHATGGSSDDIDRSVNDICVAISANRNLVYQAGKDAAARSALPGDAGLRDVLVDHNDALRSAYQVAVRNGRGTNWETFTKAVKRVLDDHHKITNEARAALQTKGVDERGD